MLSTEEGFYARAYVQCTEPDRVGGELRLEDVLVWKGASLICFLVW